MEIDMKYRRRQEKRCVWDETEVRDWIFLWFVSDSVDWFFSCRRERWLLFWICCDESNMIWQILRNHCCPCFPLVCCDVFSCLYLLQWFCFMNEECNTVAMNKWMMQYVRSMIVMIDLWWMLHYLINGSARSDSYAEKSLMPWSSSLLLKTWFW